jgi:methylthioribose-1-phosphate isomerase
MPVTTIEWLENKIRMIDQTLLPNELVYLEIDDVETLGEAIKSLRVRGAPAIGVAAALGVLIGIQNAADDDRSLFFEQLESTANYLKGTRPTAVNLAWAVDRMAKVAHQHHQRSVPELKRMLSDEAVRIYEEDRRINRKIGEYGDEIVPQNAQIITHCNTGALATVDYGTALGVLFTAHTKGKKLRVWVDETRPLLQGARLNMWELMNEGIEATLICDNMSAFVMQKSKIDLCIVGADRIARNGDTANKIGTYGLAVAAKHHGVPFYVAAPTSTIDFSMASGSEIPIESRSAEEVTRGFGRQTAPERAEVYSPAFDVTPAELISGIITEKGIVRPPYSEHIPQLAKNT